MRKDRLLLVLLSLVLLSGLALAQPSLIRYPITTATGSMGDVVGPDGEPTGAGDKDAVGIVIGKQGTDLLVANSGVFDIGAGTYGAGARFTTGAAGALVAVDTTTAAEQPLVAIGVGGSKVMIVAEHQRALYSEYNPSTTDNWVATPSNVYEALEDLHARVGGGIEDGTADYQTLYWNNSTETWTVNDQLQVRPDGGTGANDGAVVLSTNDLPSATTAGQIDIESAGATNITTTDGAISLTAQGVANGDFDVATDDDITMLAAGDAQLDADGAATIGGATVDITADGAATTGAVSITSDNDNIDLLAGIDVTATALDDIVLSPGDSVIAEGPLMINNGGDLYVDDATAGSVVGLNDGRTTGAVGDATAATNSGAAIVGFFATSRFAATVDNVQEAIDDLDARIGAGTEDGDTDYQTLYWDNTVGSEGWKHNDQLYVKPASTGSDDAGIVLNTKEAITAVEDDEINMVTATLDADVAAVDIDGATFAVDATTSATINGADADIASTTNDLTLTGANGLTATATTGALTIDAVAANVDIDAATAVTIDGADVDIASGTNDLTLTGATDVTAAATTGDFAITAGDSISIAATGNMEVSAATITVDAADGDLHIDNGTDVIGLSDFASATTSGSYLIGYDRTSYSTAGPAATDTNTVQGIIDAIDLRLDDLESGGGQGALSVNTAVVGAPGAGSMSSVWNVVASGDYTVDDGSSAMITVNANFDDRAGGGAIGGYVTVQLYVNGAAVGQAQDIALVDQDYFSDANITLSYVYENTSGSDLTTLTVSLRAQHTYGSPYDGGQFVGGNATLLEIKGN